MAETRPWLDGLIACGSGVDAEAARLALRERGGRVRSIPAGRARAAWNAVLPDRRIAAVVLGGPGVVGATSAAAYWALQARMIVTLGSGPGTGLVSPPCLLVDGDEPLATRGRVGLRAGDPVVTPGRIASLATPPATDAASASLAGAGFAAADTHSGAWTDAARQLGLPLLAVHLLVAEADGDDLPERLRRLEVDPAGARGPWRTAVTVAIHPGDARRLRTRGAARLAVREAAGRYAVAACLGVG